MRLRMFEWDPRRIVASSSEIHMLFDYDTTRYPSAYRDYSMLSILCQVGKCWRDEHCFSE